MMQQGTIEQLLVTPIRTAELLFAKTVSSSESSSKGPGGASCGRRSVLIAAVSRTLQQALLPAFFGRRHSSCCRSAAPCAIALAAIGSGLFGLALAAFRRPIA